MINHAIEPRTSELISLRKENKALWIICIVQVICLGILAYQSQQLRIHLNPQAVFEACNKGNK